MKQSDIKNKMRSQPVNGAQQSYSGSRSLSLSMEDSGYNPITPVNQQMGVINLQQIEMKRPSLVNLTENKPELTNIKQLVQRSPLTTNNTPQIQSDRMLKSDNVDLLLINEEASAKEKSVDYEIVKQKFIEPIQISIDRHDKSTISQIRWSKLLPSNTSINISQRQLSMIQDKAAILVEGVQLQMNFMLVALFKPIRANNLWYLTYLFLYSCFLIWLLTLFAIEIATDQSSLLQSEFLRYSLFISQTVYIIFQLRIVRYKGGVKIRSLKQIAYIYTQGYFILDLISITPVFYTALYFNILYFLRLKIIFDCLNHFIANVFKFNFIITIIKRILILHFTLLILTFFSLISCQRSYYEQQHLQLLFKHGGVNIFTEIECANSGGYLINYITRLFGIIFLGYFFRSFFDEGDPLLISLYQSKVSRKYLDKISTFLHDVDPKSSRQFIDVLPNRIQEKIKVDLYMAFLRQIPIFKNSCSEATMRSMCQLVQEFVVPSNTMILQCQNPNQSLYYVEEGEVQIFQQRGHVQFNLGRASKEIFNEVAFFKNEYSHIGAITMTSCRIFQLDYEQFTNLIKTVPERQKYKMHSDQMTLYNANLHGVKCYACSKKHCIDDCRSVHYVCNKQALIKYITTNIEQQRVKCPRQRTQKNRNQFLKFRQEIEEAALLYQQLNITSQLSQDQMRRNLADDLPSITKQLTTPFTSPVYEIEDPSNVNIQRSYSQDNEKINQPDFPYPNVSPVPLVSQPPSQFSHSSYGFLLKDNSVNNKKGSDPSSNMFSIPYSSSNQSKKNRVTEQFHKYNKFAELVKEESGDQSVRIQKQFVQDSFLINQKRILAMKNGTPPLYEKYQTSNASYKRSAQRSERKSNSLIQDYVSEIGQKQLEARNSVEEFKSKHGAASSKFTGETAKQFSKSPFDLPNLEFYQSFENNQQFSDYFPKFNIDQAIESYHNYQQSKSSMQKS